MASETSDSGREPINEIIASKYANMRSDLNQIYSNINDLEMEVRAIEPLNPSRRYYRLIGGMLVERTIKEVVPAVQRNKDGLEEVLARMNETLVA